MRCDDAAHVPGKAGGFLAALQHNRAEQTSAPASGPDGRAGNYCFSNYYGVLLEKSQGMT
jgi:hypothetical protein